MKTMSRGQTAAEYLLLVMTVATLVLVAFGSQGGLLHRAYNLTGTFHNETLRGIMGSNATEAARSWADSSNYP